MKKIILTIIAALSLAGGQKIAAQEFLDTSHPDKFFVLGGRIGFNTSSKSFPSGNYVNHIMTNWGTGFNAGVVANINLREYITLQPGFFYESRSHNLMSVADYYQAVTSNKSTFYEKSHLTGYYFTIPVMGVLKFNLSENIKWSVEAGPYIQFALKEKGQDNIRIIYNEGNKSYDYPAKARKFDFGFKLGSGLTFYERYYIGFHYLAGVLNAWEKPAGGKNKSWQFSIGYDFY